MDVNFLNRAVVSSGFKIFSKKVNFSIDKLKVRIYIIPEKGKKPTLSIRSDNLEI